MNHILEKVARDYLKENLIKLKPDNIMMFKRMYCPRLKNDDIDILCDKIPKSELDWAMIQVENTMKKNELKERV